jgi:hypothetical protein
MGQGDSFGNCQIGRSLHRKTAAKIIAGDSVPIAVERVAGQVFDRGTAVF